MVIKAFPQERSFLLWNQNDFTASPWEKISMRVAEKVAYTPAINAVDHKYGEIVVGYDLNKWLMSGIGFRHVNSNQFNGTWKIENRPMVLLNLSGNIKDLRLVLSNRFELRTFKGAENHYRHRQSLSLTLPKLTEWGMQFYVYEESFYKLNGAGTHLARVVTGVKALDKKHFDMRFYYGLQKLKSSDIWFTSDILGMNLSFAI